MKSYERQQLIYKFILAIVFVMCVTFLITFTATCKYVKGNNNILNLHYDGLSSKEVGEDAEENIKTISKTLKDFRELIDDYYIWDIDEQKMVDETIKGYVNGLGDEYSEYMSASEWEEYQASVLGDYVGIGVYMGQNKDNNIVILETMENSPAKEAGIQKGDIIQEVDGESVEGLDTSGVASKVKGEENTKVKLKILRGDETLDIEIVRRKIKAYPVVSEMKENNIGYIKLSTFDEDCSIEFRNAFEAVKEQGAQKLIIDLRDNTGGLVDEALSIAEMMIPKDKKMLITIDSKEQRKEEISKQDPIINMDIVVLVNEYSASASEILVGALKDNGIAKIVGTKTYGKGVIQNVFSLSDGSVIKLTTAEYLTPNEIRIHKQGIEPDENVELVEEPDGTEEIDEQLNKAIELLKK